MHVDTYAGKGQGFGMGARRHNSGRRRTVLTAFALGVTFLFLALPASSIELPRPAGTARALPRYEPAGTIDRTLQSVMDRTPRFGTVETVIQFKAGVDQSTRQLLSNLNLKILREYAPVKAVYAAGPKEAVEWLASWPGTYYMEHNQKMELLMNGTTTTINATTVWNSEILYQGGGRGDPIDGTGVTVALVDTGTDAGHPDLDYGSKTIINLKSDFDQSYTEVQDSDTGSGHGTHCAGTILGNGDASAGARRGVAPGANLVAISTGEHFLQNVLGALTWVWEHSRKGNNPYNIRVCSNSWGAGPGEYDPADSITQINNKLVFENDVAVVFAAGNSGGTGSDIQSSNYGNAPFVIEVAAALHDGDGMASFSSRGQEDLNQTWPDIAAPGVRIWATEARGTQITAMTKQNPADRVDAYYMSISGTSMATPHVAGCVALMMQAAPSLRISDVHSEHAGNDTAEWYMDPDTRITEAEYILKLTADYMPATESNGVPMNNSTGSAEFDKRPHDFAQGYGLINASRAVQVCLILEEMRHGDACATVMQAFKAFKRANGLYKKGEVRYPTDSLVTSWEGKWGYLVDARNTLTTRHARSVYIPQNASTLVIDLNYNPVLGSEKAAGELTVAVDTNRDGSIDWRGQGGWQHSGWKHDEVSASTLGAGSVVDFYVEGNYFKLPLISKDNPIFNQYREVLVKYTLGIQAQFDGGGEIRVPEVDLHAAYAQWQFGPFSQNGTTTMVMTRYFYDFSRLVPEKNPPAPVVKSDNLPLILGLVAAAAAGGALYYFWDRKRKAQGAGRTAQG
jgi:serine protease AprX